MGRAERVSRFIKSHDDKLFAERNSEGKLCIYRKGQTVEWYELNRDSYGFVRSTPHFIMALTHNWHVLGKPVDWGLDVILQRLQSIDLWNRDLASEQERMYDENKEKLRRQSANTHEDFLRESKSTFQSAFKDINTANFRKIDKRKTREKMIWRS